MPRAGSTQTAGADVYGVLAAGSGQWSDHVLLTMLGIGVFVGLIWREWLLSQQEAARERRLVIKLELIRTLQDEQRLLTSTIARLSGMEDGVIAVPTQADMVSLVMNGED